LPYRNALIAEVPARSNTAAPAWAAAAPRVRAWMWPNLLSLDAPALAVVWQVLFARSFGAALDGAQIAVLAMYVWLVYVADRTLDGLRGTSLSQGAERHRFYREHWTKILPAFVIVAAVAAYLSLVSLGPAMLRGYSWLAATGATYFVGVHLMPARAQRRWPKELAVAVLFAAGVCMPVLVAGNIAWQIFAPAIAMFAVALWLNALGIECWERARGRAERRRLAPAPTRVLAIHLEAAAWATSGAAATLALMHPVRDGVPLIYACIAASAALLGVIEWRRDRLASDAMRVLADAVFLTPIVVLVLIRMR
jgi:hypothetical protein